MLGIKPKPTDEQIRKNKQKAMEKIIQRAASMRKLVQSDDSGWGEYVSLLEEYIVSCRARKAVTSLDTADDRTLDELKKLDHEVWFIKQFILKIPEKMFKLEKRIEEEET